MYSATLVAALALGAGEDIFWTVKAELVPQRAAAEISYEVGEDAFAEGAPVVLSVLRASPEEGEADKARVLRPAPLFRKELTAESRSGSFTDDTLEQRWLKPAIYAYVALLAVGDRGLARDPEVINVPSAFASHRLRTLLAILLFGGLFFHFIRAGRRRDVFLRRIPGIDAVEEAIGRATEMGRPVLYVPGIDDQTEMETLASMVILGEVAKTTAEYDVRLLVPTRYPVIMTMAQEIVHDAYVAAGRPDAFVAEDIRFMSDEQFAFCAGVDGIIVRDEPAANLYLGAFYAESLILAETGFSSGAIQVAGTARVAQMPFFIVACDYTMLGEEFYAASAYLSKDPQAVAGIKTADWLKALLIAYFLLGVSFALLHQVLGGEFFQDALAFLTSPHTYLLRGS